MPSIDSTFANRSWLIFSKQWSGLVIGFFPGRTVWSRHPRPNVLIAKNQVFGRKTQRKHLILVDSNDTRDQASFEENTAVQAESLELQDMVQTWGRWSDGGDAENMKMRPVWKNDGIFESLSRHKRGHTGACWDRPDATQHIKVSSLSFFEKMSRSSRSKRTTCAMRKAAIFQFATRDAGPQEEFVMELKIDTKQICNAVSRRTNRNSFVWWKRKRQLHHHHWRGVCSLRSVFVNV